ncbi:hypothetical protein GQ44DRAFT_123237 [Phaeosphaeriaceae sp. PMI808]|nr:hypothetical protein GQ44DRAFT_123237 [Phaeosphaeriaceae sp. PMI808]
MIEVEGPSESPRVAREKGKAIPSSIGPLECDFKLDNSQRSTCFLCLKDLCSRSALTKHHKAVQVPGTCFICEGQLPPGALRHCNTHSEVFTAGRLFQCPECLLALGEKSEYLSGDDMLVHLATVHSLPAIVRCVLCNHFSTKRGLSIHTRGHFNAESSLVTCPCCIIASRKEGTLFATFES